MKTNRIVLNVNNHLRKEYISLAEIQTYVITLVNGFVTIVFPRRECRSHGKQLRHLT